MRAKGYAKQMARLAREMRQRPKGGRTGDGRIADVPPRRVVMADGNGRPSERWAGVMGRRSWKYRKVAIA